MIRKYIFLLLISKILAETDGPNNVCTTYLGYFFMTTDNTCYHSPDLYQKVPAIVERHIGQVESFEVITDDGYVLEVFRIPRQNPKGVILLQHPVVTDANVWVMHYNESIAFHFWKAGYDVWLPNNRGVYYSKRHQKWSRSDPEFWNFSFHEMGIYDHNSVIDFIRQQTGGAKVIFVGHSMSTTSGLIYASMRPEKAVESLKIMIHLAPIAHLNNVRTLVTLISPVIPVFRVINEYLGIHSLLAYKSWIMEINRGIAISFPVKYVYSLMYWIIFGWTPGELDPHWYNYYISNMFSEISWKTVYHFDQMLRANGRFQMYDYGPVDNLVVYNSEIPPLYPLANIQVPTVVFYSEEDNMSGIEDTNLLYDSLRKETKFGKLKVDRFNHMDYFFSRNRNEKVYDRVLQIIQDVSNK